MDSSNKDITLDWNPQGDLVASYTSDIVLLVFTVKYNLYSSLLTGVCLIYFMPFSEGGGHKSFLHVWKKKREFRKWKWQVSLKVKCHQNAIKTKNRSTL